MEARPDVLIIVALQDEVEAVLALGDGGRSAWRDARDRSGFPYHLRAIATERAEPLLVAVAWSGEMGRTAAAERARALVDELDPLCLATCGICAGRRGSVFLGDVIVADRVYSYDHGKLLARQHGHPPDFLHDIETYNLEKIWKVDASYFAKDIGWSRHFISTRPPSKEAQVRWLLHALYAHEQGSGPAPAEHPECDIRCPGWTSRLRELNETSLIQFGGGDLRLTEVGRARVLEERLLYRGRLPTDPDFQVHVGPIGTGEMVQQDPQLFERLERVGRKTLGVEMEAAAISYVAEKLGRRSFIVKAVSDYGDQDKDDSFRPFACVASAELLLAFLQQHLTPRSRRAERETPASTPVSEEAPTMRRGADDMRDRSANSLVARIEKACWLQEQRVEAVRRLPAPPPLAGLLEVSVRWGRSEWRFPIGIIDRPVDEHAIATFVAVHETYRREISTIPGRLICTGESGSDATRAMANEQGIEIVTFSDYQRILDLSRYAAQQSARLEADNRYPPLLYVPQRASWRVGRDAWQHTDDVLAEIASLLNAPNGRFLVILGDFGTGKTFLMRELARQIIRQGARTPVLLEMGKLEKRRKLNELLAQHLAAADVGRIDLEGFRYMVAEGQVVLLFDGFDELAARVSYDRVLDHFSTIIEAASERAKIVITSRTGHFLTDNDVSKQLAIIAETQGHARLFKLQPFNDDQILRFLTNVLDDEVAAKARFEILQDVKDLLGLSENPRMLSFILEIDESELREAKERAGRITSAKLYEILLSKWLSGEISRTRSQGSEPALSLLQLWKAVTDLALLLWPRAERLTIDEMPKALIGALSALEPERAVDEGIVRHQVGSRSLLVRDEEGTFSFIHQSVMEWLVARSAANEVETLGDSLALEQKEMSDLMAEFFHSLAGREVAAAWAARKAAIKGAGVAAKNALRVQRRLRESAPDESESLVEVEAEWDLEGQDLRGQDLAGQDLRGANLRGADLSESSLIQADLRGANIAQAKLIRADLSAARLNDADLTSADLSQARLLGADLRGAQLNRTCLVRAALIGASLPAMHDCDIFGAALPGKISPIASWATSAEASVVAFDRHGTILAVGHKDGTVRLWDAWTGTLLRVLCGPRGTIDCISISHTGRIIAAGSSDSTIWLWLLDSQKPFAVMSGHSGKVLSVAFTADDEDLFSASSDKSIRAWTVRSGDSRGTMMRFSSNPRDVAFSPTVDYIAIANNDATIELWHTFTSRKVSEIRQYSQAINHIAWSPDGLTIASGSDDGLVRLWHQTGGAPRMLGGHTDPVRAVAFSGDSRMLVSSADDATVRLWMLDTGEMLKTLPAQSRPVSVAVDPHGRVCALASRQAVPQMWMLHGDRPPLSLGGESPSISSVGISPDGATIISGSDDGCVRIWDAASGKMVGSLKDHYGPVHSVSYGGRSDVIASGSEDRCVRIWDINRRLATFNLEGHLDAVLDLALDRSSNLIASGSFDMSVRVWDCRTGRAVSSHRGHSGGVLGVAWGPRGDMIASGSYDSTVRIWGTSPGGSDRVFEGHQGWVTTVGFSPDGQYLASGSVDSAVRVWQVSSGREIIQLNGHSARINRIAYNHNGEILASVSADRTIRLWHPLSGAIIGVLEGHTDAVTSVAFCPTGRVLASGSCDGTIRLWSVVTRHCFAILVPLADGWAVVARNGSYKIGGDLHGGFWHAVGLCRFEPGELDPHLPGLRLPENTPLSWG